jgi:hypothetical protein
MEPITDLTHTKRREPRKALYRQKYTKYTGYTSGAKTPNVSTKEASHHAGAEDHYGKVWQLPYLDYATIPLLNRCPMR